MTLSINVGVVDGDAVTNNCERENESPHVSSRKSPRLSLSSSPSAHRGGPLSDVHSKISNSPRREESSKSSSSSTKPKPPTLPPTYANYAGSNNSNKKAHNSFRGEPSGLTTRVPAKARARRAAAMSTAFPPRILAPPSRLAQQYLPDKWPARCQALLPWPLW